MKKYIKSAVTDPKSEDPSTRIMIASNPRTDPQLRQELWADFAAKGYYTQIIFHYNYTCDHEINDAELDQICTRVEISVEQILHIYHYYAKDHSYPDAYGFTNNLDGSYTHRMFFDMCVDGLIYNDDDINNIKDTIIQQLRNLDCEVDAESIKFYVEEPEPL